MLKIIRGKLATGAVNCGLLACLFALPMIVALAVVAGSYSELLLTVAELVAGAAPG